MLYKKLFSVSLSEMSERVIYYGLQATLVLYLMNHYSMPIAKSYDLYCLYTALTFLLSIFGGFIADKYTGCFFAVLIGAIVISIGTTFLCIPNEITLYLGLSMIAVGVGLFKPNNSNVFGTTCDALDTQKNKSFSKFYLFTTIGGLLGPLIYGYLIKNNKYAIVFIFSSLLVYITSGYLYFQIKNYFYIPKFYDLLKAICLMIFLIIISMFLMSHLQSSQRIYTFSTLTIFIVIANFIARMKSEDKKLIFHLFLPIICCIIYFMFFLQIYSSLTVYLEQYFDRNIFGINISAAWFSILEPFFVLLAVPMLNYFYEKMQWEESEKTTTKITIGLILTAVSFLFLCLLTLNIYSKPINYFLIISANFLLALGEICIIPLTVSLITNTNLKKYKNTIMGIFYFAFSISSFFSGLIAKLSTHHDVSGSFAFSRLCSLIALLLFLSAFLNQVISPFLTRGLRFNSKVVYE